MLDKEIQIALDSCIELYSLGDNLDIFHAAKKEYTTLTGTFNEEDEDFEHRVNSFHDWFLFHYELPQIKRRPIIEFLLRSDYNMDLENTILNTNFSLFEFIKEEKGVSLFRNLLTAEEFKVMPEQSKGTFISGDVFISHVMLAESLHFFSRGVCLIPSELKKSILLEVKKNNLVHEHSSKNKFLLNLQRLKTKSKNYSHLPAEKVFVFN